MVAQLHDKTGKDITENYLSVLNVQCWKFFIGNDDITNSNVLTLLAQPEFNKIKIKFNNDNSYLTKTLIAKCIIGNVVGEMNLNIISL